MRREAAEAIEEKKRCASICGDGEQSGNKNTAYGDETQVQRSRRDLRTASALAVIATTSIFADATMAGL